VASFGFGKTLCGPLPRGKGARAEAAHSGRLPSGYIIAPKRGKSTATLEILSVNFSLKIFFTGEMIRSGFLAGKLLE
jgi:hypothetical protein